MVMFLVKFALGASYDHVWGSLDHFILSQFVDGISIARPLSIWHQVPRPLS